MNMKVTPNNIKDTSKDTYQEVTTYLNPYDLKYKQLAFMAFKNLYVKKLIASYAKDEYLSQEQKNQVKILLKSVETKADEKNYIMSIIQHEINEFALQNNLKLQNVYQIASTLKLPAISPVMINAHKKFNDLVTQGAQIDQALNNLADVKPLPKHIITKLPKITLSYSAKTDEEDNTNQYILHQEDNGLNLTTDAKQYLPLSLDIEKELNIAKPDVNSENAIQKIKEYSAKIKLPIAKAFFEKVQKQNLEEQRNALMEMEAPNNEVRKTVKDILNDRFTAANNYNLENTSAEITPEPKGITVR